MRTLIWWGGWGWEEVRKRCVRTRGREGREDGDGGGWEKGKSEEVMDRETNVCCSLPPFLTFKVRIRIRVIMRQRRKIR